jgi:hypothetical protein
MGRSARTSLAWLLASLLLLQWGGAPAQALAVAVLEVQIDSSICVAPVDGGHAPMDQGAAWAGVLSPALHALDHAALMPPVLVKIGAPHWIAAPAQVLHVVDAPMAPRAPPLQPRAPPGSTETR